MRAFFSVCCIKLMQKKMLKWFFSNNSWTHWWYVNLNLSLFSLPVTQNNVFNFQFLWPSSLIFPYNPLNFPFYLFSAVSVSVKLDHWWFLTSVKVGEKSGARGESPKHTQSLNTENKFIIYTRSYSKIYTALNILFTFFFE